MKNLINLAIAVTFLFTISAFANEEDDVNEAHHIKDAKDYQELIAHHCPDVAKDEKKVEHCLVKWYKDHHDSPELTKHKHCTDLLKILEKESEKH